MKKVIKPEILASFFVFLVLVAIVFATDTTGDSGDSIMHYLYSRYAFKYPAFFLNHWAKPVFVLFTAPFSQFGFKGIMVFNAICATITALYSFYTAKNLAIKNPWLVFIFIFFAPLYFKLIFSGLTEYMFGLFLIMGIYMVTKSNHISALIIISFLPLIRSEGLIVVVLFFLYYILRRKYKILSYILSGQLVYTIAGAFYYKDILWVFTKIPYNNLGSPYGSGQLFDFVHRMNYVIEKPIYFLLFLGSLSLLYTLIRFGLRKNNDIKIILIYGTFATVFLSHTLFWWLGIFNSMGLPRVLIPLVPVIALISLEGVQILYSQFKNGLLKGTLIAVIVLTVALYPFSHRQQGVVFNKELFLLEENRIIDQEILPFLKEDFPDYGSRLYYFSHPYLSLALGIDYFDAKSHLRIQNLASGQMFSGAIIIWDNWYGPIEDGINRDFFTNDNRFILLKSFQKQLESRNIEYAVYLVK
jgi:hypothetical protein